MRVQFLDLAAAYQELKVDIDVAVGKVLASGRYVLGEEVERFEREFAVWTGAGNCVGVGNGLDALTMALQAVGVSSGDEVIVPSNTFIATWLAVSRCGAIPVPVEPRLGHANIAVEAIEAAITPKTRAILPVHMYGIPAEIDAIVELARHRDLMVVEDAAQAHGAQIAGRSLGTHGDVVCWSFYPGKNLGALGDAGALTTNNDTLTTHLRMLRNYGSRQKYVNEIRGINSRMDPLQAAILSVKLNVLEKWNKRRGDVARRYDEAFTSFDLQRPLIPNNSTPSWHLYVIWHDRRDELQRGLLEEGIETLIHYPIPPHLQAAYSDLGYCQGSLPIAERQASMALSLPLGPHMSQEEVERVVEAVREIITKY